MEIRLVEKVIVIETLRHEAKMLTNVSQCERGLERTKIS